MRKKVCREVLSALAFLLLCALVLGVAGRALRPVRTDYGAVWGPYLAEPRDSLDYLYLGSSYAYCDVNPGVIYEHSGLTGYVLAGPEQTLSITYHYLLEALKTQSPQLVVLEGSALHFKRYQAYTQVNIGYMPYNLNRIQAAFSAAEPELRTGLLFDLYFYHSRWKDITLEEAVNALRPVGTDQLKGFTAVDGVFEEIAKGPFSRAEQPEESYLENLQWLRQIANLCRREGIPLVLAFHPTYSRLSPKAYAQAKADAEALGVACYDWSSVTTPAGIDPLLHFYDPGHLNRTGAEAFSVWLADFMAGELQLIPRPQSGENAAAWEDTARYWREWAAT